MKRLAFDGLSSSVMLIFLTALGCGRTEDNRARTLQPSVGATNALTLIQRTSDLRRLLAPGTTTNEIIRRFGEPHSIKILRNGHVLWLYGLPEFWADGSRVDGISVNFTNGALSVAGFLYSSRPIERVLPDHSATGVNPSASALPLVELFIVSTNSAPSRRLVDTDRFPKLGFISATPDFVIRQLKTVRTLERMIPISDTVTNTDWIVAVSLTVNDSARFALFTKTNTFKTVLITINREPISAVRIVVPIETGEFDIACHNRGLLESLAPRLAALVVETASRESR